MAPKARRISGSPRQVGWQHPLLHELHCFVDEFFPFFSYVAILCRSKRIEELVDQVMLQCPGNLTFCFICLLSRNLRPLHTFSRLGVAHRPPEFSREPTTKCQQNLLAR